MAEIFKIGSMMKTKYKLALDKCKKQRDYYIQKYNDSMVFKGVDISQEVKENNNALELILNPKNIGTDEEKSLNINAKPGTKVIYLGKNGYDSEREFANKFLKKEKEYTVSRIDIGNWSSLIYLDEIPGKGFNSVMFAAV